ncbi:MAG: M50 family metallopeptidase [Rhodocyclaceae bacterium]|nr:M50 family metallopeptidase [Rhodocyclaceae bacterium]
MTPFLRLIISVVVIAGLWQLPYGRQILYPLTLLATLAHELGHGIAALAVGAQFESLVLHPDGSGLARWSGSVGPLAQALIAAGGLLGPTLAGVLLLAVSRWPRYVPEALGLLAVIAVAVALLWVRNLFGLAFILALAVALALGSRWLGAAAAAQVLNLLAVTLCLSLYQDLGYMFSATATVAGATLPSDSAAIAAALWLPYWFWGALIALTALVAMLAGVWFSASGPAAASSSNPLPENARKSA